MSGLVGFCAASPAHDVLGVARRMATSLAGDSAATCAVEACDPQVALGRPQRSGPRSGLDAPARRGEVCCWLAGQVFGRGDAETPRDAQATILEAYLTDGGDALAALGGEFIAAIWDGRAGHLLLVNDRFGLLPHYVLVTSAGFGFAPRMRPLLEVPGAAPKADVVAIAQYLRFQQLLGERTWLAGVTRLPPASVLRWHPASAQLELRRYWSWRDIEPIDRIGLDEAVEHGTQLLERAVRRRCDAGGRVGVFLSGGLDSRVLAGLAAERGPLHTFTFGHPGCRDVHYAAKIARATGAIHHVHHLRDGRWLLDVMPRHLALTEAQHSFIHAHGMSMLDTASGLVDLDLTGWDGGTVLRGRLEEYDVDPPYRECTDESSLEALLFSGFCRRFTWPGLTDEEASRLTAAPAGRGLPAFARASFAEEFARTRGWARHRRADWFYVEQHVLRSTINLVVFTRSALDVLCPFWDDDLARFLYGLPDDVWATPRFTRAVITRRLPKLARIPNELDLTLPHESPLIRGAHRLWRRTCRPLERLVPALRPRPRLYADYENYLRHELRPWAEALLFDERTLGRGFYDVAALRALWDRHVSGRELHTIGKIAPIMAIEMALRYLVEGDTPEGACGIRLP
jgi:asparagine synthase (glutamine-hydrolysing)